MGHLETLARSRVDEALRSLATYGPLATPTAQERDRYSYKRIMTASGELNLNSAPYEKRVSDDLSRACGQQPRRTGGFFIPPARRDLTVASGSGGGYTVSDAEELTIGVPGRANSLRSLCTIIQPGVNTGAQRVGRFDGMPAVSVLANESDTATEDAPTTSQTLLTPSHDTTYLEQSRQLVLQTEGGARALVSLLQNTLNTFQGTQIFEGSGNNGEVLGLVNDSAISSTSGANVTWTRCVRRWQLSNRRPAMRRSLGRSLRPPQRFFASAP